MIREALLEYRPDEGLEDLTIGGSKVESVADFCVKIIEQPNKPITPIVARLCANHLCGWGEARD